MEMTITSTDILKMLVADHDSCILLDPNGVAALRTQDGQNLALPDGSLADFVKASYVREDEAPNSDSLRVFRPTEDCRRAVS